MKARRVPSSRSDALRAVIGTGWPARSRNVQDVVNVAMNSSSLLAGSKAGPPEKPPRLTALRNSPSPISDRISALSSPWTPLGHRH